MRLRTIKQSEESTPRILPPDVRILPPAAMARPKVSSLLEVLVESVDSDCGLLLELAAAERASQAGERASQTTSKFVSRCAEKLLAAHKKSYRDEHAGAECAP